MPDEQMGCCSLASLFKSILHKKPSTSNTNDQELEAHHQTSSLESKPEEDSLYIRFNPCCDFSYADFGSTLNKPPSYSQLDASGLFRLEVAKTIEATIDRLNLELRELSLQIHDHPEVGFEEKFAHDTLTAFMSNHGFSVTGHYLGLETAWRAESTNGKGGRTIGINSEMDALPGLGHACGHNLIAIAGVGVAIAIRDALLLHDVAGSVVLLGTPAEEGGAGKVILLERGGYRDMDACIMSHPGPGLVNSAGIGRTIAMQGIQVEYFGHAAHAGALPWEGTNALDAAFLAYSAVSVLRQQVKPDHRVHGVIHGKNWVPNIIPDYANMRWYIRAPTYTELVDFRKRIQACFEAAATATSCKFKIKYDLPYYDVRQNSVLANDFSAVVKNRYGIITNSTGVSASVDFGNVSYELPAFHPHYAIPTMPSGSNHTPEFAKAARTQEAHDATIVVMKGLALTGFRVLSDDIFFGRVKDAFTSSGSL